MFYLLKKELQMLCNTNKQMWKEVYLKLRGKTPSRTEIVQLADTWPVKAFEPLVRYLTMHMFGLTFFS